MFPTELNVQRGCGKKRAGGTYLEGVLNPRGTLRAWTWVLGTHLLDRDWIAHNLFVDTNPRTVLEVDAADLVFGVAPGSWAVLDHVGRDYTPWSFAAEVKRLGPSRRVASSVARAVAQKPLPVLILFTHNDLPFFHLVEVEAGLAGEDRESWTYKPTWWDSTWGFRAGCSGGESHYVAQFGEELAQGLSHQTSEAIFGASWITCISYYALPDEDEDSPGVREMLEAGIRVARLIDG